MQENVKTPQAWRLEVSFDGEWVLERRNDEVLPIDNLLDQLKKTFSELTVEYQQITRCSVIIHASTEQEIIEKRDAILADMGAADAVTAVTLIKEEDLQKEETTLAEPEAKREKSFPSEGKIRQLIGAEDFKKLAKELIAVAPQILKHKTLGSFLNKSYLFTIGDGCGLSTQLMLFSQLLEELELFNAKQRIEEISSNVSLELMIEHVKNCGFTDWLVCIDISQWMDKIRQPEFQVFLRQLSAVRKAKIYVFRIPFVDEITRRKVLAGLSDVLTIREVVTNPHTMDEVKRYATQLLSEKGFNMDENAWKRFEQRVIGEKSDGHFYGLSTIEKIIDELFYQKHISVSQNLTDLPETIIGAEDIPLYRGESIDERPAMEQLDELVGIDAIRKRIDEVLAQIKVAELDSSIRPCLHMRFVGAPGTGKTTVARILGKLMKEQKLLSKGQFFEYAGRDFCGQYIGETAPKTAAMCRDAYGSVLFIDEAYSLYRGDKENRDYGREAIDTLVAQMENHRNDFMVIMAGYNDDMKTMMEGNVGLASRMPYTIEFANYGRNELFQIFMKMATKAFKCEPELEAAVKNYFDMLEDSLLESKEFANARFVRNLFERTWGKASVRHQMEPEQDFCLRACDFDKAAMDREFSELQEKKQRQIGFTL
jgi:ATP-dependent 26S proteasome regulatory subunit